jgi:hypothetical protein
VVSQPRGGLPEEQVRLGQLVSSAASSFVSFLYLTFDRDVDELKALKEEILTTDLLDIKLGGMSFVGFNGFLSEL